jgi:hypothetical protein
MHWRTALNINDSLRKQTCQWKLRGSETICGREASDSRFSDQHSLQCRWNAWFWLSVQSVKLRDPSSHNKCEDDDLQAYIMHLPLPTSIHELRNRITHALQAITADLLHRVWDEFDYSVDVCRVTQGAYIFFIGTTAPVGLGLPPWNSPFHFGFFFLNHRQSAGLLGRVISPS